MSENDIKSVHGFKLIRKGSGGVEISAEEFTARVDEEGNTSNVYKDFFTRTRTVPVPDSIIKMMETLKYYFLNITGHWIKPYDKFIDFETMLPIPANENSGKGRNFFDALWQKTFITQVRMDGSSFSLYGILDIVDGKPLAINPPKITYDDDEFDFIEEARERIANIMALIIEYFRTVPVEALNMMRQYMLDKASPEMKAQVSEYSDEQISNMVLDELSKKGGVVLLGDHIKQLQTILAESHELEDSEDQDSKDQVLETTAPSASLEPEPESEPEPEPEVDVANNKESEVDQSEMPDEGESWEPPVEKVKDPFGPPAAKLPGEDISETEAVIDESDFQEEDFS